MSILIKGMEMPKDCLHCCFASGCSYCEGYNDHCVFEPDDIETDWDFDHGVFPESIPDWCPLVPVPPHGRLIDADALHKLFEDQWHYLQVLDWNENPTAEANQSGINWCINTMHDNAPTIIPASGEGEA